MTLSIGTLPTRRHQPVRVIRAVYPVPTREQRHLNARHAGHMGRLVALGVALTIAAFALFSAGGSNDTQTASSGGLPVIVPEARSAPSSTACPDVALRSGLCSAGFGFDGVPGSYAYLVAASAEGRA